MGGPGMGAFTLPARAKPLVALSAVLIPVLASILSRHPSASVLLAALALAVSGYVADAFTGVAHFAFDYALPYHVPALGPIAREFNEHHEEPTLDPSDYVENFTKGAYASLLAAALAFLLWAILPETGAAFFVEVVTTGLALWALFFHQIHSYAHVGSKLQPQAFNERVAEIAQMKSESEQTRAFRALFATVPIPAPIRVLQRGRLILCPERHNLHHLSFEKNFSSVNGWSDALLNPFLGPLARAYKARRATAAASTSNPAAVE
jgi:Lipid desaturase domain